MTIAWLLFVPKVIVIDKKYNVENCSENFCYSICFIDLIISEFITQSIPFRDEMLLLNKAGARQKLPKMVSQLQKLQNLKISSKTLVQNQFRMLQTILMKRLVMAQLLQQYWLEQQLKRDLRKLVKVQILLNSGRVSYFVAIFF